MPAITAPSGDAWASVLPTSSPTLSASDIQTQEQEAGTQSYGAGTNQGLGSTYISQLPTYAEGFANGTLDPNQMGNDPAFQWFQKNGLLDAAGGLSGNAQLQGLYNMGGVIGDVGPLDKTGHATPGTNPALEIAPNNALGQSTLGGLDVKEIQTPQQNPSMFGTDPITGDPLVSPYNLEHIQDSMDKYGIPIMEGLAGAAFGGLMPPGAMQLLGAGESAINGNPLGVAEGVGLNAIGSVLPSDLTSGLGDATKYIPQGLRLAQAVASKNPVATGMDIFNIGRNFLPQGS